MAGEDDSTQQGEGSQSHSSSLRDPKKKTSVKRKSKSDSNENRDESTRAETGSSHGLPGRVGAEGLSLEDKPSPNDGDSPTVLSIVLQLQQELRSLKQTVTQISASGVTTALAEEEVITLQKVMFHLSEAKGYANVVHKVAKSKSRVRGAEGWKTVVMLKPDCISDSFLADPSSFAGASSSSFHGNWPKDTKFPAAGKQHVLPSSEGDLPKAVHLKFHDSLPAVSDFFLNPLYGTNIGLDSRIFGLSSIKPRTYWVYNKIDSLTKEATNAVFVCDELAKVSHDRLLDLQQNMDWSGIPQPVMDCVQDSCLAWEVVLATLLRVEHFLIAALVVNKKACRESVLERFTGDTDTKQIFLSSPFCSKDLFGPLTSSYMESIIPNAKSCHSKPVFSLKTSYASSSSKTFSSSRDTRPSKRPRYEDSYGSSTLASSQDSSTRSFGGSSSFRSSAVPSARDSKQFFRGSRQRGFPRRRGKGSRQ